MEKMTIGSGNLDGKCDTQKRNINNIGYGNGNDESKDCNYTVFHYFCDTRQYCQNKAIH